MPTMSPLAQYLTRLDAIRANQNATAELSLRPALEELFKTLAPANVEAISEGKKQASGRPDFTFSRKPLDDVFGYVEAEKPTADLGDLKDYAKHRVAHLTVAKNEHRSSFALYYS